MLLSVRTRVLSSLVYRANVRLTSTSLWKHRPDYMNKGLWSVMSVNGLLLEEVTRYES